MNDNDSAQAVAEEEDLRQQAEFGAQQPYAHPQQQPVVVQPQHHSPPPSQTFSGVPRGFRPPDPNRDRPLKSRKEDRLYLDVDRTEVGTGSPTEAEDGWCGQVNDDRGFKKAILDKWGGGVYLVTGRYNGEDVEKRVKLPGKSKPIVVEEEEEEEQEDYYDQGYYDTPRGRYDQGFARPALPYDRTPGGGVDSYGRPVPYAQDPYGHQGHYGHQGPYGQPPYQGPYGQRYGQGQVGPGWQGPPPGGAPLYNQVNDPKENELAALRASMEEQRQEIAEAREEAAKEREDRRLDNQRAEARRREQELKAQIERAAADATRQAESFQSQLASMQTAITQSQGEKGGGFLDKMLEMQMLESRQADQRREADRVDRDAKLQEEKLRLSDENRRRDKDLKHESEQKAAERKLEAERMERDRDRERKFFAQQMDVIKSGQQSPGDMLGILQTAMALNPREDATTQIANIATMVGAMKDILGGGNEENATQGIIRTAGEAAATALRELRGGTSPVQVAEDAAMLEAAAQQHQQQLPYDPAAHEEHLQAQAQLLAQQEAEARAQLQQANPPASATRDATPDEWGRIAKFVVEGYMQGNSAEDTVPHLNTFLSGLGVPAVMLRFEGATVGVLRWQIGQLGSQVPQDHPHRLPFDAFAAMLEDEERGVPWVAALLDSIRTYLAAIRETRRRHQEAQAQAQAQAQQAAQAQAQEQAAQVQELERARATAAEEAARKQAEVETGGQQPEGPQVTVVSPPTEGPVAEQAYPVEPPPGEHEA